MNAEPSANQPAPPIMTFSTRPVTLGELELAIKCGTGDVSAMIDLLVTRSDPKVTREFVCSLFPSQITEIMPALQKSIETAAYIENLFRGIGGM